MTRLHLALFDVDGTLVDSQGHIKLSMTRAFESENLTPPAPEDVKGIIGLSLPMAISRLAPNQSQATVNRLVEAYKADYSGLRGADAAASSPLYHGALECLTELAAHPHVFLGVATGKSRRGLTHVLEMHNLTDWFHTTQVADDHPSKPHPSMVIEAMRETGVDARDVVMIGDTTYDMEMGAAAGVRRLGVSWGYHSADALCAAGGERLAQRFDEVPVLLKSLWEDDHE